MSKVMMTITAPGPEPSLDEVKERYDLADDEIDANFGIVEIDPDAHVYTVLVDEQAAAKIQSTDEWETSGPFGDTRIAPFGPPEG